MWFTVSGDTWLNVLNFLCLFLVGEPQNWELVSMLASFLRLHTIAVTCEINFTVPISGVTGHKINCQTRERAALKITNDAPLFTQIHGSDTPPLSKIINYTQNFSKSALCALESRLADWLSLKFFRVALACSIVLPLMNFCAPLCFLVSHLSLHSSLSSLYPLQVLSFSASRLRSSCTL